jgi:tetratricopeptide (TPR) repeat protein
MKKIILLASIGSVFLGVLVAMVYNYYFKVSRFNDLKSSGETFMMQKKYDMAIGKFNEALKYKQDKTIEQNIAQLRSTKEKIILESKAYYDDGLLAYSNKDYGDAVFYLKYVSEIDKDRYSNAQELLKESKEFYVKEQYRKAESLLKEKNYEQALKEINEAILIKPEFEDAKKIRQLCLSEIEKKEEIQEQAHATLQQQQEVSKIILNMNNYETGIGNIAIAVSETKVTKKVDTGYGRYLYYDKNVNMQFVWLCINALNKGLVTEHVNPNDFTLSTSEGLTVNYESQSTFSLGNYFQAINLNPQGQTAGWLIFAIPKSSTYIMHYNGLGGSMDKKIIIN